MIVTLPPDNLTLTLPDLFVMVMGPPNSGKSALAASAETPMIVLATDPDAKLQTYFARGVVDEKVYVGAQGQLMWIVRSAKTGKPIIQVEGFYDEDEKNPQAMTAFIARIAEVAAEVKAGKWRTVVVDSWSQLEWIAKVRRSFGPFSGVDSVYGAAKDDLENVVKARLMNMRCNRIVVFHIETKVQKNRKGEITRSAKDMFDAGGGDTSYTISAIGTLKNLANVFGECYLAEAPVDGSTNYLLQTRKDADFRTLESRIGAPNPCRNNWNDLFGPWIATTAEKKRSMLAALAAGESEKAPAADAAATAAHAAEGDTK